MATNIVYGKVKRIEMELNEQFFERMEVVRGLLVGLLAKQHVLLLGPPGTAKSEMTENLCRRIGGTYFKKLVTKTSTPEELYGPVSLKGLEQDQYYRITNGRLPKATLGFIDEIFKCNSAVLNGLLNILNEREFENGGKVEKVPLEFLVGASNELPEDREELEAVWDRFLMRFVVGYIQDPRNFEKLFSGGNGNQTFTTITEEELNTAQAEVDSVDISGIVSQLMIIRGKIKDLKISVSDRRFKNCISLVKANAWLECRDKATADDLEILIWALWQEPNQIANVRKEIMGLCNPFDRDAQDLHDQAVEQHQNAMTAKAEDASQIGVEANVKLKAILQKLEGLQQSARNLGKNTRRIEGFLGNVRGYNEEVLKKCLGL